MSKPVPAILVLLLPISSRASENRRRTLFEEYCVTCHNDVTRLGG
jgi:hypothetical protein